MSEFKNFTEHLQDKIFEETSIYLSNVIGSDEWGEEFHDAHGAIMWNAVEAIAKRMGLIKDN